MPVVMILPDLSGVNQTVFIEGVTFPPPGYSVNDTYTITKPNGTTVTILQACDAVTAESSFNYVPDQVGWWRVKISWAGDATHGSCQFTIDFYVQTNPVADVAKVKLYAYVDTMPKTVGDGESIYIVGWLTPPRELSRATYQNLTFKITKPDGTTDTVVHGSDSPATYSFNYICDQAGTWSVTLSYAGDRFHESCVSDPATWTVQEGYVKPTYPSEPLPTGPWQYPISAQYYEWYQISGEWGGSKYDASFGGWNPYSRGPNTAHILWDLPSMGGMIGGKQGWLSVDPSSPSPFAWQGRLYYTTTVGYTTTVSGYTTQTHSQLVCLDQYTGKQIYAVDLPGAATASLLGIELTGRIKVDRSVNPEGAPPTAFLLWLSSSSALWAVDPWTGRTSYYVSPLPAEMQMGTPTMLYANDTIYTWPSWSQYSAGWTHGNLTAWDCVKHATIWTLNVTAPPPNGPGVDLGGEPGFAIWNDLVVIVSSNYGGTPYTLKLWSWNATDGTLIANGPDIGAYSPESAKQICLAYGKAFFGCIDMRVHAIDLYTGREAWKSDPATAPWGSFQTYGGIAAAYGNIYLGAWDGYTYCYDAATGKQVWKSFAGNSTETATGTLVPYGQRVVADGKVYFATGEHTPPNPEPRGHQLFCLDAYTGKLIWSFPLMSGSGGISSGMLWYSDRYTGSMFMFGKGQTATTVSVSPSVTHMETVMIQGTVTDQSPGAPGTPAVSDASQSQWMEYLYLNKPMPTNATGVTVHLQAMGSDGTVIDITHVTTDIMGHYEYLWCPPAQDTYKILATFEGSDSYWTSSGQCGLGAIAVLPTASPPAAAPDNTFTIIGSAIAVIVAVAIVGMLILRKRP